jgi:hypothetical protein
MIRVEIVANRSVEENLLEAFRNEGVAKFYTKYPSVFGVGSTGPRMGDAVWPEENFALVVWCEAEEADGIARAVASVKKQFPDEGIKLFRPEVQAVGPAVSAELPPPAPEASAFAPPPEAPAFMPPPERKPFVPPRYYGPESENS